MHRFGNLALFVELARFPDIDEDPSVTAMQAQGILHRARLHLSVRLSEVVLESLGHEFVLS